jgi:hypothetical protein
MDEGLTVVTSVAAYGQWGCKVVNAIILTSVGLFNFQIQKEVAMFHNAVRRKAIRMRGLHLPTTI